MPLKLNEYDGGIRFSVKVQPRASRNRVCGVQGDALKIQLTAPPVDGAANQALIAFWADALHIARSNVTIVQGESSRLKVVQISNYTKEDFMRAFPDLGAEQSLK